MKIFVKNEDGKMYEAFQIDESTYTLKMENKTFELSLSEADAANDVNAFLKKQKKSVTKAVFSNEEVLEQLRDARKNRDSSFSYYSGDEIEFDKLVDEMNSDR